jgi:hypothetical protein
VDMPQLLSLHMRTLLRFQIRPHGDVSVLPEDHRQRVVEGSEKVRRDVHGTPTILKRFTIGRRVWVRTGTRWDQTYVYSVHNGSLILRDASSRETHVHYSVLHRDVRVTDPTR